MPFYFQMSYKNHVSSNLSAYIANIQISDF